MPCAVLALPRGGVPVAAEVASFLRAPLDLILVRKIGAPMQPELAIGAVVDGGAPVTVRNRELIEDTGTSEREFQALCKRELAEIERRRAEYLGGRTPADPKGRIAIVIDDGIATGATMRAALQATRMRKPKKLILAVPVAPAETLESLRQEADEVICLETPKYFGAVGHFYEDFGQLTDDDVRDILVRAQAREPKEQPAMTVGQIVRDLDEVKRIVGDIDDAKGMAILALKPEISQIEQAVEWAEGAAEALAKSGHPLTAKVAEIYDLLTVDEEEEPRIP
jgi:predicted phosphoribosyltransferase